MQLNLPNFSALPVILVLLVLLLVFSVPVFRYIIKKIVAGSLSVLLKDKYTQDLIELFPSITRFSVLNLVELSLRAEEGKLITRPLGSPKKFVSYDNLMFNPRQMTGLYLPAESAVNMEVSIGSKAEKPLKIKIPLMIGGMAYGLGLSAEAKLALAKASKILQTATNSGGGPFLPEEPDEAGKFILQVCRWSWEARTDEQIALVDMLEVQMWQGADIG